MKRDMETIRAVLEAIEAEDGAVNHLQVTIPGVDEAAVGYHLALLHEGGYLIGDESTPFGSTKIVFHPIRLTWQGHELLDTIRSKSAWASVKAFAARQGGSISAEVMKMVALQTLKSQIGFHGPITP